MTDEEVKSYVDSKFEELKDGMIDIASLPRSSPDAGTSLPFVKDEQLVGAPVEELGGVSDDSEMTEDDINAAIAAAT